MIFLIPKEDLEKALADIKAAEKNGFMHCKSVFKLVSYGSFLDEREAKYSDMSERAHPTNGALNWGTGQNITKNNAFKDGKLVPIK